MTAVDHAELKRVAERATPYWQAVDLACGGNPVAADLVAPFVGLMSPSVVLALLSEIEGLKSYAKDAANEALEYRRQLDALRTQAPDSWRLDREAVARIVDPAAFLFTQDELMKGDPSQFNALSKADRIIAALRNRTSEPEAGECRTCHGTRGFYESDDTGFIECPMCAAPATADKLPEDVRRLVLAARAVAFGPDGGTSDEINELDKASEAFASRVSWDDEPDAALRPQTAESGK